MTALFVRNLQPQQFEPANTAERIVGWYAAHPSSLWILLIALPLAVVIIGGGAVLHDWHSDAGLRTATRQTLVAVRRHLPALLTTAATLTSALILAIVALHMATD